MKPAAFREGVADMADRLADAYSSDRYAGGWSACIKMLRRRGLNDKQVEAVIRSKWTRWAGDMSNKPYGRVTSKDLERFMDNMKECEKKVLDLTRETFGV